MLNFLSKLISLISSIFSWWKSREKARKRDTIRKAVAEHDRETLNRILQERRTK